jgi:hypothetical protein
MNKPRVYVHEAKVYVIRDLWDGGLPEIGKFISCEYATLTVDGAQLSWTPCAEGVDFKDIEPLFEVRE